MAKTFMPNMAIVQLARATTIMPTRTEICPPETLDRIWPPTTLLTMLYPTLVKTFSTQHTLLG